MDSNLRHISSVSYVKKLNLETPACDFVVVDSNHLGEGVSISRNSVYRKLAVAAVWRERYIFDTSVELCSPKK